MLLSSLGVQFLARDPKTTAKILNACSTTTKSWRRMYSIKYKNRYLINISKLEEEEVGKELGGYSPYPRVIIRKKIGGRKYKKMAIQRSRLRLSHSSPFMSLSFAAI
jgi:hypothetical protein